jgi:dephospho-CoA kinase
MTHIADTGPATTETEVFSAVVALTGGAGCGKSTVADLFGRLGAAVVSADELAREAVLPGASALYEISQRFGSEVLNPDGTLDRRKLAAVIFADPDSRKALEQILHPKIRSLARERFLEIVAGSKTAGSAVSETPKLIVYEVPLLFESGLDQMPFKYIVSVISDPSIAKDRLMKRAGVSAELAEQMITAQLPNEEKAKRSDFVVVNDGLLDELEERCKELYYQLL